MTRKVTKKMTKHIEKVRNSKKQILIFETKIIVRIILNIKAIIPKIMTIRKNM